MREFAERDIWVTHGNKKRPFRVKSQPFLGELFDCYDDPHWWNVYVTGPSQSSKTTGAFLIPIAHTAFELRENLVAGIPLDEMVDDKFNDLFRMMRISPNLRRFLPKTHLEEGKGGKIKEKFTFTNGVEIKPITMGGSDQAAAGYPARHAIVTEAAGFSKTKTTSSESNRLRQIIARLKSHDRHRRRLRVEGTLTIEQELPWNARGPEVPVGGDIKELRSSLTQLLTPCPHCPELISPEREHLFGWQDAETEDQAMNEAYYACPSCGCKITDDERRRQMQYVRAVHWGQSINEHGELIGEKPPVHTLFFHWKPYHNLLLDLADAACEEWRLSQIEEGTQERENAEKEITQFTFSRPFKSTLVEEKLLDAKVLRKRTDNWGRGILPPDTTHVTMGIDLGDWTGHWLALAWRKCGVRSVVAYGCFDIKRHDEEEAKERLDSALDRFEDETITPGFIKEGQLGRVPLDYIWIDGNYLTDEVAAWVRRKRRQKKYNYRFARGAGASARNRFGKPMAPYRAPTSIPKAATGKPTTTKQLNRQGNNWYSELNPARGIQENTFNSDYWKVHAAEGLGKVKSKKDRPLSIVLYRPDSPKEHARISNHFANEQLVTTFEEEKGHTKKWVRKGDQHWLDCLAMALAAGDEAGFRLADVVPQEETVDSEESSVVVAIETAEPTPAYDPPTYDWGSLR